MAEAQGFEPWGRSHARRFSRPVHSTTLPNLRNPSLLIVLRLIRQMPRSRAATAQGHGEICRSSSPAFSGCPLQVRVPQNSRLREIEACRRVRQNMAQRARRQGRRQMSRLISRPGTRTGRYCLMTGVALSIGLLAGCDDTGQLGFLKPQPSASTAGSTRSLNWWNAMLKHPRCST